MAKINIRIYIYRKQYIKIIYSNNNNNIMIYIYILLLLLYIDIIFCSYKMEQEENKK